MKTMDAKKMKNIFKKIVIIITILILIIYGLSFFRYGQSQKYFSADGQYSFYSKMNIFEFRRLTTMGYSIGGTVYIFDEIEKKVISQFESSWLKADMEMCDFSNYDGGIFSCKAKFRFNLPRPLKNISPKKIDKKIKSGFNIKVNTDFETAQKTMHFYKSSFKDRFMYYVRIPDRKLMITTSIFVKEKESDILNITLDSILHCIIKGNTVGYYSKPKKEDVDFAVKLTEIEIENLFKEQVYKQIENK